MKGTFCFRKRVACGLIALVMAVLILPGTVEAASKSGTYDGCRYTVTATKNRNYGSGSGVYADTRKSMALTVKFYYTRTDNQDSHVEARRSGTTSVSAATGIPSKLREARYTSADLYIAGATFSVNGY